MTATPSTFEIRTQALVHAHSPDEPTRAAGLARLAAFLPQAGRRYDARRNVDFGPYDRSNVSMLSAWIRHRLVREDEVVQAVLARHNFGAAEKFIQEVVWRTYWKGWLEMRPAVWQCYRDAVEDRLRQLDNDRELRSRWEEATSGRTGIACFDQWTGELLDTGYLHNHARMWFSSIWIFTLRLPWELGADFFFRFLNDGDSASNTLSWRWVAGLQTRGRTYLARPDNIAKFTAGRFEDVRGLADEAAALLEPAPEPPMPLPKADPLGAPRPVCLLISEDDCDPLSLGLLHDEVRAAAGVTSTHRRSPLPAGALPTSFSRGAVSDALGRIYDALGCPTTLFAADAGADDLVDWARSAGVGEIVALYAPVGPTSEWLSRVRGPIACAGIRLITVRREWDTVLWPHATKGFFRFRERVPAAFRNLGIG